MEDHPIDLERLDRFVCAKGNEAERNDLARWVAGHPARQAMTNVMRTIGERSERIAAPSFDAESALKRVQRRLGIGGAAHVRHRMVASSTPTLCRRACGAVIGVVRPNA